MSGSRPPAVAGSFYPADSAQLRAMIRHFLHEAPLGVGAPKALIAPHAGFVYSGPTAACAYARLGHARDRIRRVVLVGPSHRAAFTGLALSGAEVWNTPLGAVHLDPTAVEMLRELPFVRVFDHAHAAEHSLEVHLPFLQEVLSDFTLVPLLVGAATTAQVAEALDRLWGGEETVVIVSSDLSHYLDYAAARQRDEAATAAILALEGGGLDEDSACGRVPIRGLLLAARTKGLKAELLDLRSSGDTAGDRARVVGYGAYAFA